MTNCVIFYGVERCSTPPAAVEVVCVRVFEWQLLRLHTTAACFRCGWVSLTDARRVATSLISCGAKPDVFVSYLNARTDSTVCDYATGWFRNGSCSHLLKYNTNCCGRGKYLAPLWRLWRWKDHRQSRNHVQFVQIISDELCIIHFLILFVFWFSV